MDLEELTSSLLTCQPDQIEDWIRKHQNHLSLPFLQLLKDRFADHSFILTNPDVADRVTRLMLEIAVHLDNEPAAIPLTQWARGLWAMVHDPQISARLFQQAQPFYITIGDKFSAARLAANLVGVLAEYGDFPGAISAYAQARPEFLQRLPQEPLYLLRLEQNYGWLLHGQGHYYEALEAHEFAIALAQEADLQESVNEIRINRALTLGMLGRLNEVEKELLNSRVIAAQQGQRLTHARIEMNLGELYTALGKPADGLRHFAQARQQFSRLENAMELGSVYLREGLLLQRIGAWEPAIRAYHNALLIFQEHQMKPQIGQILVVYATARRLIGDYREANDLLQAARSIWQELENHFWLDYLRLEQMELALVQGTLETYMVQLRHAVSVSSTSVMQAQFSILLAELLCQSGATDNRAEAERLYEKIQAFAEAQSDRWLLRRVKSGLGRLLLQTAPDVAVQILEEGVALDDQIRSMLSVEELKADFVAQSNDLLSVLIDNALQQNRPTTALHYSWRMKSAAMLELIRSREIENDEQMADTVAPLHHVRQQLATLRWQSVLASEGTHLDTIREQNTPEIAALEQELLRLRRQANRTWTSDTKQMIDAPEYILPRIKSNLLLEYVQCGDDLIGFCADPAGQCQALQLCDVETVLDLQDEYQLIAQNVFTKTQTERKRLQHVWQREAQLVLGKLYDLLIRPFPQMGTLPIGSTLLISPCAALHLLPFTALWNGERYMMEQVQLEFIHSGALLGTSMPQARNNSAPVFIAGSGGDALPSTQQEVDTIVTYFPNAVTFVDQVDAVAEFIAHYPTPRFLHIAAHTLQRHDAPILSALQLHGETLSVEQCYELPLQGTELVILSSCTTAGGLDSGGALLAFQTALFVAGSQRVIASLWPVADEDAAIWMSHFYRFWASGQSIPRALQSTQMHLLSRPQFSHPAIWAAFACSRR